MLNDIPDLVSIIPDIEKNEIFNLYVSILKNENKSFKLKSNILSSMLSILKTNMKNNSKCKY